jgi:hypothetical protein
VASRSGERTGEQPGRLLPRRRPRDEFGEHRVIVHPDLRPVLDARVQPDPGPLQRGERRRDTRDREAVQDSRGREPAVRRVLGVEAYLDRVPARRRRLRQRLPLGDEELKAYQVQAEHGFGDRVLDLEPGVHLEEEELAGPGQQELDRTGAHVPDGLGRRDRRGAQLGAQSRVDRRRRGLFQDLLVPALDGALPLAECEDRTVLVGEHLDLDVAGAFEVGLAEDRTVAEGRRRLPPGGGQRVGEPGRVTHDAHAAAAAPGRGLDEYGEEGDWLGERRQHRYARGGQDPLRLDLRAHRRDRLGRRTDPDEPGIRYGMGEVRVLGEEAVPGVDRVGSGPQRRRDDEVAAQVRVARRAARQPYRPVRLAYVRRPRVGVGVHRDRVDAERAAAGEDPAGDLAPVGNQQPTDHRALTSGRRRSARCR